MTQQIPLVTQKVSDPGSPIGDPHLAAHEGGKTPDITVVITASRDRRATKACLDALFSSIQKSRLSGEVILLHDHAEEKDIELGRAYEGRAWPIRIRGAAGDPAGPRDSVGAGRPARGRYLCLLRSTVVVSPGWLDRLVEALESAPDIGLVGPKFLDEQGRTLEAGGMVYSNGVATPLGAGTAPDDPRFSYVNDVHYCSTACAVTRADLFQELGSHPGGEAFAHDQGIDYCLALVEKGFRILVVPDVRVTRLENASNGGSGQDAAGNLPEKLLARWKPRLEAGHPAPSVGVDRLRSWLRGETILFVWPTRVNPRWSAGGLRNWLLMSEIRTQHHFHVVCVAPWAASAPEDAAWLQSAGIEYHHGDANILGTFQELIASHRIKAVVLCFVPAALMFTRYFAETIPAAIRVFDTVDLVFLRELRGQSKKLTLDDAEHSAYRLSDLPDSAATEVGLICQNDLTLVVSEAEAQLVTKRFAIPRERLCVVSTIHEPESEVLGFENRRGFSFIGYGRHEPNVDAIQFLASELWPAIRARLPDASLHIYGSDLPPEVTELNDPTRGFHVLGFVREHRKALERSRVMLAPLRFGAGVKGKIGESLAVGTVVVTTPVGAEGMDGDGSVLAVGDTVDRLADLAVTLHERQDLWDARSEAGRDLLRERFSGKRAVESMAEGIERAVRLRQQQPFWHVMNELMLHPRGNSSLLSANWSWGQSPAEFTGASEASLRLGTAVVAVVERVRRLKNRPVRSLLKVGYWALTGQLLGQCKEKFGKRMRG